MLYILTCYIVAQPDTTDAPAELFSEVIDINSKSPNGFFSAAFAPTIPPLFLADPTLAANNVAAAATAALPGANVNADYKSSLLEKYSRSKVKNSLFHPLIQPAQKMDLYSQTIRTTFNWIA